MEYKNKRAGGGALEGLRVFADYDTHHTPDHPQGKSQRDRARDLLTDLRGRYPVLAAFRPLSIGIRGAHAAVPGVAHKLIDGALDLHCHSDAYLQAIAAGGPRYALGGAQSGEVTEEHRVAAVLVLSRRAEKSVVSAAPKLPRLAKPGRPA